MKTVNRRAARSLAKIACMTGVMLAVAGVSGCGQKGPLFWPQDKLEEIERKRDEKKPPKSGLLPGVPHLATYA